MKSMSGSMRIVVVAIGIFIIFFGASNWLRQVNLYTAQFDMGNMDQVLWHSLHGEWFRMASPVYGGVVHARTAIHADFLLLAYLPFYAIWPDPRTPLVLQVIAVGTGAIPLFWLARKKLGEKIGAMIAILYLLYPPVQWAVTFDVHAVVLAMPLLIWAWWAMVERRWRLYALVAGLALLGKEEIGLVIAALGLYWVWRAGHRRAATVSMVFGVAWSMLMLAWAIPQARQVPGHFALGYFSEFGDSYSTILSSFVIHPIQVVREVFDGHGLSLLRALFTPLAFLPLIGWPVLLVALPEFAINLLSNNPNQQTIFFQYMSAIVPFLFIAMIDGWVKLNLWLDSHHGRWPSFQLRRMVLTLVVMCAMAGVWVWSPLPGTRHSTEALAVFQPSPYRHDIKKIQALLAPTDRLATTNNLAPQFSRRDMIWAFPNNLEQADVAVVLEGGDYDVVSKEKISEAIQSLLQDPTWSMIYHRDRLWFFRHQPL